MLGDERALRVVLMPGDGARLESFIGEVATEDEGKIVAHVLPGEAEERLLGLEIADLQHAPDLVVQAGAPAGERQLRLGEAQVLQPLRVVEIGESVQGILFGGCQHGQQVVLRCHGSGVPSALAAIGGPWGGRAAHSIKISFLIEAVPSGA